MKSLNSNLNLRRNLYYSILSYCLKLFNNIILFAILARLVSVDVFGIIVFFVVLIKVSDSIIESGHKLIIVKEISANKSKLTHSYLTEKIVYKSVVFLIVLISVFFYGFHNHFWNYHPILLLCIVLTGFFSALSNINIALFHAFSKFHLETISLLTLSLILCVFLTLSWISEDEQYFIFGYFAGSVIMFLVSWLLVRKNIVNFNLTNTSKKYRATSFIKVLKYTIPFSLIILIEVLFGNFDLFFIEYIYTNDELGMYSGLKKIISGICIFMLISMDYLMPKISKLTRLHQKNITKSILKYFLITNIIGIFIFITYWLLNTSIINILLGTKYLEIEKWHFNVGVISISIYLRAIPNLFFITFGYKQLILKYHASVLLFCSIYFYFKLNPENLKSAIDAFTNIQIVTTSLYLLIFFHYLFFKHKRHEILI